MYTCIRQAYATLASSVSKAESVLCQFCGKNNHSNADCRTRTSEFTNNQNRPYVGSETHGRLVKATGDRDWIPNFKELKGLMSKVGQSSGPSSSAAKTSKSSKDWKSKGTYVSTILLIKLHVATSPNLLPVVLTFVSQEEAKGIIHMDALLDTGCLAGDFVARRIVDRFNIKPVINSAAKLPVCSGLDNTSYDISKSVIISVNYPSFTSLMMRIYNLDYVHSVQNLRIFLVMTFLMNLLISLHSI